MISFDMLHFNSIRINAMLFFEIGIKLLTEINIEINRIVDQSQMDPKIWMMKNANAKKLESELY